MMQGNQVLSFFRPRNRGGDWSQRELAEFYRVEAALVNSGIPLSTDRGLTDEGDPWFVFCRKDNDEVIIHFARIGGEYVIVSNLSDGVVRGRNFAALVGELLHSHPNVLPKANPHRQTVYLHPAAFLAALIVTAYVKSGEMNSGPDDRGHDKDYGTFFDGHSLAAFSALVVAAAWDSLLADPLLHKLTNVDLFEDASSSSDSGEHAATPNDAHGSIFDHLALRNADQPIEASHFSPLSVKAPDHNTPSEAADQATALIAQINAPSYHTLTAQFNDSNPGSLEASSTANDVSSLHSNAEQNQLTGLNDQMELVVATDKSGLSDQNSTTDMHGSSSPAPAVQTAVTSGAVAALGAAWDDLRMNPQDLHPVILTATTLFDAVETTLSQLPTLSHVTPASSHVAGASTTNLDNATDVGSLFSSSQVHNFDAAAQVTLELFFKETPHYNIEYFGHDVLVVDTDLSHYSPSNLETWKMSDGSTLSIVGQAVHNPTALAA